MFRGTYTALVTPFQEGALDLPALEKLIEEQIAAGITGVVAVGTTGESPTLSHEEKEQVIRLTVEIAKGRCQVLAGTGSNSTAAAVRATEAAEKMGVDGMLVVVPYYNKPSQEGLFRHFRAIAQATTVEGVAVGCRNIVSIKEASGSVERVSDLRARLPEAFTILSGDDSLTLPFLSVGAVGVVSVASNVFPAEVCALVQAFRSGDVKTAREMHLRLLPVFKDLFIEPNPVPTKTALAWRGAMSAECRLPLCEMTEKNAARLRTTLDAFEGSA